jgi:hypothetical protein
VPLPLLGAYAKAMPALRAMEEAGISEAVAMGSGTLEKSDARRIQERWREATQGGQRGRREPPSPEFLASKGIAFRRERPGEAI